MRTNTRTAPTAISITPAPHHNWSFKGTKGRIHRRGHIWLDDGTISTPSVTLSFQLPANFVFQPDANGDVMYTSSDPNALTKFDPCGGVFTKPSLSADRMTLQFDIAKYDGKLYYYLFNIHDVISNIDFPIDPIIVNK